MVKVSLEFKSVDEAIVALGKLVDAKPPRIEPVVLDVAPASKPRKPRADKGQPREPYGPRQPDAAANPAVEGATAKVGGAAGDTAVVEKQADSGGTAVAAPAGAPTSTPSTPAPAVAPATLEQATAALGAAYKVAGHEACRMAFQRFGCAKLREMKPEHYGAFAAMADRLAAIKDKPGTPEFDKAVQAALS